MKYAVSMLIVLGLAIPVHANEAKRSAHDAYKQERANWKANGQVPPSPRRNPKQSGIECLLTVCHDNLNAFKLATSLPKNLSTKGKKDKPKEKNDVSPR